MREQVRKKAKTATKEGDSILQSSDASAKRRKKKHRKDKNAPLKPLNAYVLFLNKNRPRLLLEQPDIEFANVTKKLAAEWAQLSEQEKEPFVKEAADARLKYKEQLLQYKASDAFRSFQQSLVSPRKSDPVSQTSPATVTATGQIRRKPGRKPKAASESAAGKTWLSPANGDIPIFTDAFLEHNKVRETELRKLRRLTTEYEEQNAILSKHIDKMRAAEAKLRTEMQEMTERMSAGEEALLRLKQQLVTCLANCSVPRLHAMPASTCLEEFVDQVQASLASVDEKEEREARERLRLAFTRFLASEETSLPDSKALEAHQ